MWPIKKDQERRLNVVEMRMLRWMCRTSNVDGTSNDRIRGTVKVLEISRKAQKRRLERYGHVIRREEKWENKINMEVEGRRRGKPKRRWRDCLKAGFREKGIS